MNPIGELIDKLTIVNIKIWDATEKSHLFYEQNDQKKTHEYLTKVESMNVQRKELINEINTFFKQRPDALNDKSYKGKTHV